MIYLDNAATTPLAPGVLVAMRPWLEEHYGNPSSIHQLGRAARNAVDEARDRVAAVLGCGHGEVIFTATGTEANNLALRGIVERAPETRPHLVVSAVEHDAVLDTARRLEETGRATLTVVGCDRYGAIDPGEVGDAVRDDTVLVSVMLVNNEVGTVMDVAGIVRAVRNRRASVVIHTDAVQALGKLPIRVGHLDVDLLTVSGHKLSGPKGAAALFARRGTLLEAQVSGGRQERNRRSGTENVAAIVGFGVAADLADGEREVVMPRLTAMAARLTERLVGEIPGTVVTGHPARRVPSIASFAFAGVRTELLLAVLDEAGVCASGGSACAGGALLPSHVLAATGLDESYQAGALRCSLGRATTNADVDIAAAEIQRAVAQVRSILG